MAYIGMAYIAMAYTAMAYVIMAYAIMAYTAMAYIVMAYVIMAYVGMALAPVPDANNARIEPDGGRPFPFYRTPRRMPTADTDGLRRPQAPADVSRRDLFRRHPSAPRRSPSACRKKMSALRGARGWVGWLLAP